MDVTLYLTVKFALAGIGKFTLADEATVSDPDLGVNFFLDESCKNKSRAQCWAEFLTELNPEVEGKKEQSHAREILHGFAPVWLR